MLVELELLCEVEGEERGWDGLVWFLEPVNGRLKELQGGWGDFELGVGRVKQRCSAVFGSTIVLFRENSWSKIK